MYTAAQKCIDLSDADALRLRLVGADPNMPMRCYTAALTYAAGRYPTGPDPAGCVRALLDAGADPNGDRRDTPLMAAARWGNLRVIRLLLAAGADPALGCPLHDLFRNRLGFSAAKACWVALVRGGANYESEAFGGGPRDPLAAAAEDRPGGPGLSPPQIGELRQAARANDPRPGRCTKSAQRRAAPGRACADDARVPAQFLRRGLLRAAPPAARRAAAAAARRGTFEARGRPQRTWPPRTPTPPVARTRHRASPSRSSRRLSTQKPNSA